MNKCFKIPSKIKTKNDAKPKNSYMKVASSWSKNVLLQKIFEKVRTQRNLVRTQRELVYKHKCALNENALNEALLYCYFYLVQIVKKVASLAEGVFTISTSPNCDMIDKTNKSNMT